MRKRLDDFKYIKIIFTVFAVVIVAISVYYSNKLADDMAAEERQRISLWAEATRRLVSDVDGSDLSFILKVIEGNNSIPVLVVDDDGEVVVFRNIEMDEESDKEFIEEINTNSPALFQRLYLSTDVVQRAVAAQDMVIKQIADNGSCVIVGRAADYVLKDYDNLLRVFVYAPMDFRVKRIMEVYGDTHSEAVKNIKRSDNARSIYYEKITYF